MQRLNKAIQTATTGDLQRAAMFLEGARRVRAGCTNQRAQARRAQTTAWIRDAVYSELKRITPASVYNEAEAKDQAEWRQSVRRRVEGRAKPTED